MLAPRRFAWVSETLPALAPDELLVQTLRGAVSVGTELPQYCGTHRGSRPLSYPKMTGYESLGRVVACGTAVSRFQVGDIVVAFYGQRTHAILKETQPIPVPANIPWDIALLAILGCDTHKGIEKLAPRPDERVLITGAGTIGLLTLFNLKARGVAHVDLVEPQPQRRQLAIQLGATRAMPPKRWLADSPSYQVGIECSSRDAAFGLLQGQMGENGRICILADGNLEPLTLAPHFHERELRIVGSSDGVDYQGYARWFFQQSQMELAKLLALFEVETEPSQLPHVFEEMANTTTPPLKVLVHYPALA